MHELYKLKDSLIKELESMSNQGISKSNIDMIDKVAHATKNVAKVIECCESDEYSNGYSRRDGYSRRYNDGGSYANDGTGNYVRPDGSYARGRGRSRDSMGRYSSAEDEMISNLERLMETASDEHTRKEIQKLIDRM